jgi:hypothetical protein
VSTGCTRARPPDHDHNLLEFRSPRPRHLDRPNFGGLVGPAKVRIAGEPGPRRRPTGLTLSLVAALPLTSPAQERSAIDCPPRCGRDGAAP